MSFTIPLCLCMSFLVYIYFVIISNGTAWCSWSPNFHSCRKMCDPYNLVCNCRFTQQQAVKYSMTSCAQNKCTPLMFESIACIFQLRSFAAKPPWNALKDVVYQAKLYQEIQMISSLWMNEWWIKTCKLWCTQERKLQIWRQCIIYTWKLCCPLSCLNVFNHNIHVLEFHTQYDFKVTNLHTCTHWDTMSTKLCK